MNIGIFSLSCCEGCSVQFLNLESKILDILKYVNIKNFRLVKNDNGCPIEISFVEGTPTTTEEINNLKKIRKNSKIVVALGTCAATGGIQALLNTVKDEYMLRKTIAPKPIDYYINVDYFLYGCPFSRDELIELITSILMGKKYRNKGYSVCVECSLRENNCLLDRKELCMGPVIRGGCKALCPSNGKTCTGCRGPYNDANFKSHISLLTELGFTKEEIMEMYSLFSYEKLREVITWLKEK